ncbi:hypothetical protein AAD018_009130 [Aestuariibius insulae]|uniref:hypothetical protein n=1 Tax=Aestuariibius insulae TaxID=2058287 RepID=UPI00398F5B00
MLELTLFGRFSLRTVDGTDITPKSKKACGLLALLAYAPEMKRSRAWLVDHLWSDRHPDQGLGSLRQELSNLRKCLENYDGCVQSDRRWIWLSSDAFDCLGQDASSSDCEFLEGLDIRDQKFNDWRSKVSEKSAASSALVSHREVLDQFSQSSAPPISICCVSIGPEGASSTVVADVIATRIAEGISEHISVSHIANDKPRGELASSADILVECSVVEDNGFCVALIKVVHVDSGKIFYSKTCQMTGTAGSLVRSDILAKAAFDASEVTVEQLPHIIGVGQSSSHATALSRLALHKLFTFEANAIDEADQLLLEAYSIEKNGVFLAWAGLLNMIRSVEVMHSEQDETRERIDELIQKALSISGQNGLVRALAAQTTAILFRDPARSLPMAEDAVEMNPSSSFALQALATSKMLTGETEQAYAISAKSRNIASRSQFRQWWDLNHSMICVATGRFDEALALAEAVTRIVPTTRPMHRYLLSLYAEKGNFEAANRVKQKLIQLEPGFTLDQMIDDPEYPVHTLRRAGLIAPLKAMK